MHLQGCPVDMPSRSTALYPASVARSAASTTASSRRLASSKNKTPRLARARIPGENAASPVAALRSMSTEPSTASSVAPRGIVRNGASRISVARLEARRAFAESSEKAES
jgi:hypothetical protein